MNGGARRPNALTDEQRQLVENNMKLVYRITTDLAKSGKLRFAEMEDAEQAGMLGLVKAAKAYDEGRGIAFSTLAFACIRNELWHMYSEKKRQPTTYSLDAMEGEKSVDQPDRTLGDAIQANDDTEAEVLEKEIEKLWSRMETCGMGRHADALRRNMQGETYQQIGDSMGITKQRAAKMARLAKEQLRRMMVETSY